MFNNYIKPLSKRSLAFLWLIQLFYVQFLSGMACPSNQTINYSCAPNETMSIAVTQPCGVNTTGSILVTAGPENDYDFTLSSTMSGTQVASGGDTASFTNLAPDTYSLLSSSRSVGNGCSASFIIYPYTPTPVITTTCLTTCQGTPLTLTATPDNLATGCYSWHGPSGTITGGNTFSVTQTGDYYVTIPCGDGSTLTSNTVHVTVCGQSCCTLAWVTGFPVGSPTCGAEGTGAISASVTGGTPPYFFQLDAFTPIMSFFPTYNFTGLSAGTYMLTVTDSSVPACTVTGTATVALGDFALVGTSSTPSCSNGSNGTITITISGGVSPYFYSDGINTFSSPFNTFTFMSEAPGTYTVSAEDSTFCTIFVPGVVVGSTPAPTVTILGASDICGQNPLVLTAIPSPAGDMFTYVWTNSLNVTVSTSSTYSPTTPDTYTVTVTDHSTVPACSGSASITVNETLTAGITATPSACIATQGGSVSLLASVAQAGTYQYVWTIPHGGGTVTGNPITASVPGVYTVNISDLTQPECSATASIIVAEAFLTGLATSATCQGDITITGTASSGNSIVATSGVLSGSTTALPNGSFTISPIHASTNGTYTFTVVATDNNDIVTPPCTVQQTIPVTVGSAHLSNVQASADCLGNVTVIGTADAAVPNDTITVTVGGHTGIGSADGVTGNFTVVVTGVLPANTYPYTVTATNNTVTPPCSTSFSGSVIVPSCSGTGLSLFQRCNAKVACDGITSLAADVKNIGGSPATGVTVTEELPFCFTFLGGTGDGWSFVQSGNNVIATYNSALLPGQTASFSLAAKANCCCLSKKKVVVNATAISQQTVTQPVTASCCIKLTPATCINSTTICP